MKIKSIYLSFPIRYCKRACLLEKELASRGFLILNPCNIIIKDRPRQDQPAYIANECYMMIDNSDALVLFADYYGRDCATEIGYAIHAGKPVFPLSFNGKNSRMILSDWMIRAKINPMSKSIEDLVLCMESIQVHV